jgi:hypothetical protein
MNHKLIYICALSGNRTPYRDYKGFDHYLDLSASDEDLASALLDSLSHSRFLPGADDPELFDHRKAQMRFFRWAEELGRRCGCSKNEAMKHLMNCGVERVNGEISVEPSQRVTLDGWAALEPEHIIRIPEDSPSAEIGAALRLGLDRCS